MSALLDSLAAPFDGDAERRDMLDALLRDGLPHARAEAWKYTPLRALERRSFATAEATTIDPEVLAAIPSPRIVFVNGRFDAALSALHDLPEGVSLQPLSQLLVEGETRATNFLQRRYERSDEPFARLNAALAREGAVLRIEDGVQVVAPIHLVFVGAAAPDAAWHLRQFIELRRGANATVVEHHLAAGEHAHLGNGIAHVHVAAGARLRHVRLQDEAARATQFARTDAVLAREAVYERVDLELGAALSRHELNVRLEGEGATLRADGVLLADGRRHVDTRLGIDHLARDTSCSLTWRGLAGQRGKAVFHGGITIAAGADGSEANLSNKNLLLSSDAEIDTQPVLEIHADEVKAAHGATVGQLDPTALFYLRSRGLTEADARRLLTAAFCREVVAGIDDDATRTLCDAALDRALARLGA
ncbi:Fe-S cluster assembly protein SufD [Thermomonas sp. HDW16]|uniref:Fe-S cluster assembly protein SufD n=1 Tax=Thermomonas sp. HDW16 TaxID=2714945 RepID=UPI0014088BDC|nr:Fe-S cluster assembly protein SufD [Thermomonas sp. HDW16]QIL20060.1 Fe-S cluster assembly protein SufD [Thermomonas sp. HDW16]